MTVLTDCVAERPDGARGRLSRGSDQLRSHVAVSRHVYRNVRLFRRASSHPHSAALPSDVHLTRHQEGRRDRRLAGLHPVNLSAD